MKKSLLALVAVLSLLIGMVSVCTFASADECSISVDKETGAVGTEFVFTCGGDLSEIEQVNIYKDGNEKSIAQFSVKLAKLSYTPTEAGSYTAKLVDGIGDDYAQVSFTVTDAAPAITITGAVNGVVDPTKLTDGKLTFTTEIKWEWAYIFAANDATLSSSGHWLDYIEKAKGETFPSGQGLRNKPNGSSTGTPWTLADGDYVLWLADSSYYGDLGRVNFTIKTPVQYTDTYYVGKTAAGAGNGSTKENAAALGATNIDDAIANGCTTISILGNPTPNNTAIAINSAKPWKNTLTISGGTWDRGFGAYEWKLQGDSVLKFSENLDVNADEDKDRIWTIYANGHALTLDGFNFQKKAASTAARNVQIVMGEQSAGSVASLGSAYTLNIKKAPIASTGTPNVLTIRTSNNGGGAYTIPSDVKVTLGDPTTAGAQPIKVNDIQLTQNHNQLTGIVKYGKNVNIVVNDATINKFESNQFNGRLQIAGALQIIFNNGIDGSKVQYVCNANTQTGTGFQLVGGSNSVSNKADGGTDGGSGYITNGQYIINSAKEAGCYLDTTATKGVYTVYGDKIAKAVKGDVTVYSEEGVLTVPSSGVWNVTYEAAGETVLPTTTSSCTTGSLTTKTYANGTVGLGFVNTLTLEEGNKIGGKAVKEIGFLVATKKNVDKSGLLLENVDGKKFLKGTYDSIGSGDFNVTFCGIPAGQVETAICGRLYIVLEDDSVVYNNITTTSFGDLYRAVNDHSAFSYEINEWFK